MFEVAAEFFRSGGPLMWVILAVLAGATAVIAERLHFYLVVCRIPGDELVSSAAREMNGGGLEIAMSKVDDGTSPTHAILSRVMESYRGGYPMNDIRRSVDEVAIREVPRFGRRLGYLAMLANVATLSGLLGTIFGLQRSFSSLAVTSAVEKASVLASGISQAMNTTAFGLIVAIPCMVAYTRLSSMQARRTEDCDAAAVRLLNYIEARTENPPIARERQAV